MFVMAFTEGRHHEGLLYIGPELHTRLLPLCRCVDMCALLSQQLNTVYINYYSVVYIIFSHACCLTFSVPHSLTILKAASGNMSA